jgi:hypothetical protein
LISSDYSGQRSGSKEFIHHNLLTTVRHINLKKLLGYMEVSSRLKLRKIDRSTSILNSPKIHSVIIILVLIFLTILAAVLIYDILYSRTNVGNDIAAKWIGSGAQPFGQNESQEDKQTTNKAENQSPSFPVIPSNGSLNNTTLARKDSYLFNHPGNAISGGSTESTPASPKRSGSSKSGKKRNDNNSRSASSVPRISSNKTTMASSIKTQMQGDNPNRPDNLSNIRNGSVNLVKELRANETIAMMNIKNKDGLTGMKQINQGQLPFDQASNETLGLNNSTSIEASKEIKSPSNNTTTLVGQNKGQNTPLIEIPQRMEGSQRQRIERSVRHERSQRQERAKRAR